MSNKNIGFLTNFVVSMNQQTQIELPDQVSIYNNEKIILDTENQFRAYETVEDIQKLKEEAEFGLHYPYNEPIVEACDYMLDLRFA